MTSTFVFVLATLFVSSFIPAFVAARASPNPGLFEGWFTYMGNNPAFKCNKAPLNGQQFDNVVIQTRLHSFDNEDDDLYTGSDCDTVGGNACDPKVKVYIDATTPTDTWPSNMRLTEIIEQWDANDIHPKYDNQKPVGSKQHAYTACKVVPKLSLAAIRVSLEDVDSASRNDIINHMNCFWAPSKVAGNEAEAQWETINCCTAFGRKMKSTVRHELKMDVRAFRAGGRGSDSCPNGEGRLN